MNGSLFLRDVICAGEKSRLFCVLFLGMEFEVKFPPGSGKPSTAAMQRQKRFFLCSVFWSLKCVLYRCIFIVFCSLNCPLSMQFYRFLFMKIPLFSMRCLCIFCLLKSSLSLQLQRPRYVIENKFSISIRD